MVITLSGVTGSGKSYYKKMLQEKLNLDNQIIYTTRPMRKGEVNGIDKFFVTDDEFDKLEASKKVAFQMSTLGDGLEQLTSGLNELNNGSSELAEGMTKFNNEGIKQICNYINL